jgi:hypothetical protein
MQMNRRGLIKLHMLLASFIFPVAVMFFVTGAFYTWGIKGSYIDSEYQLDLEGPIASDVDSLKRLVAGELDRLGIEHPTGKAKVKTAGTSFKLEWTGSERDVVLEPTQDPSVLLFTVKETSWYRNLVQLHKAKGGTPFKVYAAFLAGCLFLILLTGFVMALQVPMYRNQSILTACLGLVAFAFFVFSS